jgi:hypothetical protein
VSKFVSTVNKTCIAIFVHCCCHFQIVSLLWLLPSSKLSLMWLSYSINLEILFPWLKHATSRTWMWWFLPLSPPLPGILISHQVSTIDLLIPHIKQIISHPKAFTNVLVSHFADKVLIFLVSLQTLFPLDNFLDHIVWSKLHPLWFFIIFIALIRICN